MFTETPDALQNLCLTYIARNIVPPDTSDGTVYHKDKLVDSTILQKSLRNPNGSFLHSSVADVLLWQMSEFRTLCSETVDLFHSSTACLRHVIVRRSPITAAGLRILRSHKLLSLSVELDSPKQLTVTDIMCCLNEWTVANLQSLSVTGATFGEVGGPQVIVSLCALKNLRYLDVSRTNFNENMLKIIVNDLPLLESLNISSTSVTDVTSLSQCRMRLRQLLMYNVRLTDSSSVHVLQSLLALQVLDISQDLSLNSYTSNAVNSVITKHVLLDGSEFDDLVSIDISGTQNVQIDAVRYQYVIHIGIMCCAMLYFLYLMVFSVQD